ncbi:MAG: hypothetical protein SFX73_39775 [Kofleriaceae bacterium]|nr:hypothetical protein [Kofleriaceae bacterium]
MGRWQRYWFAEGGRWASACVRIAIAVAVLMSLSRIAEVSPLVAPGDVYRPVGPWRLFGGAPPPGVLVDLMWVGAWGATVAMLVGAGTRIATPVSFACAMPLAAMTFSSTGHWSHQYNVVFLAQLAFLGARAGDVLSVDAWLRHRRGLPAFDVPRGYMWSLRLVQLAVALMFAGAVTHKLISGGPTLGWALSDNLRHQLLVRYDLAGLERPPLVEWLIDDVWKFRIAALLNLVTQLVPIIACIFVRRPWLRVACAVLFVVEVLALALVVDLWNLQWLPLAAVYIDWDWALRRAAPPAPVTQAAWKAPRVPQVFVALFVLYDAVVAFAPSGVDQKLNTYPFSGFPMFASVRARRPFTEHQPYSVAGDHFEPLGAELGQDAMDWMDHRFRGLYRERDVERLRERLAYVVDKARISDLPITGVRHHLVIFEAPAYPARARFERHPIAVTAELSAGGTFRTLLGTLHGTTLELRPRGIDTQNVKLVYYAHDRPAPIALQATRSGDRFELPPISAKPLYIVAIVDGVPWLAAAR